MKKEALLREFARIVTVSLILVLAFYAADVLITPSLPLPISDLLFIEGLLFVVFGVFFLATEEPDTSGQPQRAQGSGISRNRLFAGGVLRISIRRRLASHVVRVTLVSVSTGLVLIALAAV